MNSTKYLFQKWIELFRMFIRNCNNRRFLAGRVSGQCVGKVKPRLGKVFGYQTPDLVLEAWRFTEPHLLEVRDAPSEHRNQRDRLLVFASNIANIGQLNSNIF